MITNIPAPRVPFIDERTGLMAREWYRFFLQMFIATGIGENNPTVSDLAQAPVIQSHTPEESYPFDAVQAQVSELQAQFDSLLSIALQESPWEETFIPPQSANSEDQFAPPLQIGTSAYQNADDVAISGGTVDGVTVSSSTIGMDTNTLTGTAAQFNTALSDAEFCTVPSGAATNGTYTPTFTNVANIDASTPRKWTWLRVGNTVTVAGLFDADATAASVVSSIDATLPVASNFSTIYQCGGAASPIAVAGESAGVYANPVTDKARIEWLAVSTANQTRSITFSYEVI